MMPESIESLEEKYQRYAEAHGAGTLDGDFRKTNRNYHKLIITVRELRKRGDEGRAVLLRLMHHSSDAVACWAATHCLAFAEKEALQVLDTIAKKPGIIGHDAQMVAIQWRKGELLVP